ELGRAELAGGHLAPRVAQLQVLVLEVTALGRQALAQAQGVARVVELVLLQALTPQGLLIDDVVGVERPHAAAVRADAREAGLQLERRRVGDRRVKRQGGSPASPWCGSGRAPSSRRR